MNNIDSNNNGYTLVLKLVREDMTTYGGFRWPESGPVEAPDYSPTTECGYGLHGWARGSGDYIHDTNSGKWLVVRVPTNEIIDLGDKCKFRRGEVVFCGSRVAAVKYLDIQQSDNPGLVCLTPVRLAIYAAACAREAERMGRDSNYFDPSMSPTQRRDREAERQRLHRVELCSRDFRTTRQALLDLLGTEWSQKYPDKVASLTGFGTDAVHNGTDIFVFGSNQAGAHGAGAARHASDNLLAEWGVGEGVTGGCYAIPTKDYNLAVRSLDDIRVSVDRFIAHAAANPGTKYFVTRVGCGYAGYSDADIAPMLQAAPDNCELPPGWRGYRR